jgi:hypothetical protein
MKTKDKIVVRIYEDKDDDLLEWLGTIPEDHGAKSTLVKRMLRQGLQHEKSR